MSAHLCSAFIADRLYTFRQTCAPSRRSNASNTRDIAPLYTCFLS